MAYRLFGKRARKAGLPPGSLVYVGDREATNSTMVAVVFDDGHFVEAPVATLEEALALRSQGKFLWLNVDGLGNSELIRKIGEHFSIHSLALEDVLNSEQRPKREEFDDLLLVIAKSIQWSPQKSDLDYEQISIVLGKDFILSFQEKEGDAFTSLRQRMRPSGTRLRKSGPDYLLYIMLDLIVDQYFVILENFGEKLDRLEDEIVSKPEPKELAKLYHLKRSSLFLRRSVWPLREALGFLQYGECKLIKKSTLPFLRDVYSHCLEALDAIEIFREMLASMLDVYLSSASNKMNVVIKVLTIITTIFMPLTLIAGIYGMNFQYMPELHWHYGYPLALALMAVVAIGMLALFRIKKWL